MKKLLLLLATGIILTANSYAQTVTDLDGNVYTAVTIGSQKWLQQDLRSTHYQNGDSIPNVKDTLEWCNMTSGAYCNYDNLPFLTGDYGRLYNWFVASDPRNACPLGYHPSTYYEWDVLGEFIDNQPILGGKLKEAGTTHWISPNTGADNSYGFTALPGGWRALNDNLNGTRGRFDVRGYSSYWWTTDELGEFSLAYTREIFYDEAKIYDYLYSKQYGFAIRCVHDSSTNQINESGNPEGLIISPNPATTTLNITGLTIAATAEVYDISGKQLLSKRLTTQAIDISRLAPGLYFIRITTAEGSVVKKFVKE